MTIKFQNRFGNDEEIFFKLKEYSEGERKAIQAFSICRDDGGLCVEPYAMATVNLPEFPLPEPKLHGFYCFLDVNNFPEIESILMEHGIGIHTGMFRTSGFCQYPIYFIFTANLKKYRCEL